jgi:hypothetical protein
MDASTYQEYRDIYFLTKIPIRSKMGVVLAISQDRFDIIPHQTPSGITIKVFFSSRIFSLVTLKVS